jgi:rubredoxin
MVSPQGCLGTFARRIIRGWGEHGQRRDAAPVMRYFNLTRNAMNTRLETAYKTYMCLICGFVYEEAKGLPEEGLPAGTRWEDIPMNWVCPECGARKEDFEMIEI